MKQKFTTRLNLILTCLMAAFLVVQLQILSDLQQPEVITVVGQNQSGGNIMPASESKGCTATVSVRVLNQRSGPGQNYSKTGDARRGESFAIKEWDESHQWVLVSTSYGEAWMFAGYMTLRGDCHDLPVSDVVNDAATPAASRPERRNRPPVPSIEESATATPAPETQASSSSSASETGLSPIFTPEVQYWAEQINTWAVTYQLDPNLIATVIQIESCGNPAARSSAGAQGLFQVMPFHFAAGEEMLDVETNARRGLSYLKQGLELANGDAGLALAGYNGGHGVITSRAFAAETQRYYYRGSGIYAEASAGLTVSPTLQEWLAAGGTTLCAAARQSQQ